MLAANGRHGSKLKAFQVPGWAALIVLVAILAAVAPRPAHAASRASVEDAWSHWSNLGMTMGTPSVVDTGTGLMMFIRGTGSALWERTWNGSSWSAPLDLGGTTLSRPEAVVVSPTVVDVFIRGNHNGTWYRSDNAGVWGPWETLAGVSVSAPAVDSPEPGQIAVFVRGTDSHQLWEQYYNGSGWTGWRPLGGVLGSAPSATSSEAGHSDVVARGSGGAVWYLPLVNNVSAGWRPLGGVIYGDPSISSWGQGRLDVFAEGTNHGLFHSFTQPGFSWSGWTPLGGILEDGPTSFSSGPGLVDALVLGTDDSVFIERWTGTGWTGFVKLGMASTGGQILNVPYDAQVYELSCEEASLQMALGSEDIPVTQAQVLSADGVNSKAGYVSGGVLHWGDPYQYFVGNINGSEVTYTGYGTYDTTIVKAANHFGGDVIASGQGISPASVYAEVLAGHPVVAWISFDYKYHAPGTMIGWDGRSVIWSGPIEHTVTVVGVNSGSVLVYNPWYGIQWISRQTFTQSYASYDDMAVVLD